MPLLHDFSNKHATILLWQYEAHDELDANLLIEPENRARVEQYLPKKMAEYLMIRQMLKNTLPDHKILYRTIGQPYLFPKDAFISITHSFPLAALAISKKRIGIDVERVNEKIIRIKEKFLFESEYSWIPKEKEAEYLTVIWVIKEALYKLHPSKYWSLKKHYEVLPFCIEHTEAISCRVFDDHFEDQYVSKVLFTNEVYFAVIEEDHQIHYKIPAQQSIF